MMTKFTQLFSKKNSSMIEYRPRVAAVTMDICLSTPVVLDLGFTGRFPGVLGWRLSFHVLLLSNILH